MVLLDCDFYVYKSGAWAFMKVLKHGQQKDVMGSVLRTETEATIKM